MNLRTLSRHDKSTLVGLHTFGLVLLSTFGLLGQGSVEAAIGLVYPACVVFVLACIWLIWSWRHATGTIFGPYGLFLLSAILFGGGQALLEVVGLNQNGILGDRFEPDLVLRAVYYTTMGLSAVHLGALLSLRVSPVSEKDMEEAGSAVSLSDTRLIGWWLLAISAIPAAFLLKDAAAVVYQSGYFALYQRQSTTGLGAAPKILADFLVPSAFFLLAGHGRRRSALIASVAVMLSYSSIQLYLGYRAYSLLPLVAYVWLWDRCVAPISRTLLWVAGTVVMTIVMPLVALVRNQTGAQRLSMTLLERTFSSIDNPVMAIVSEMGKSMEVMVYSLIYVPSSRAFDLGIGYLYALSTIFPNIFWTIHPIMVRGTMTQWLVWTVDPGKAALGGGLGFSFIAEAYVNFGWLGGLIWLVMMGWSLGRFLSWATAARIPGRMAAAATFLSYFLVFPRMELATIVRPLIWYALVPYFGTLVVRALRSRFASDRS